MPSQFPLAAMAGVCAVAISLVASPIAALAAAPTPVRPVTGDVYTGRWYEVARTPNLRQRDCLGSTTDFDSRPDGGMAVTETCRRAGPAGLKVVRAKARVLQPGDNTRFRVSLVGGLIHQDYWILDHADDNAWLLMGTPGGHYVWVLSRRPALPSAGLAAAIGRASALGYPSSSLIYAARSGG